MSATKDTAESFAATPAGLREQDAEAAPRRLRRGWLVRRVLLAADVLGLLAAFFATELLFANNRLVGAVGLGPKSAIFVASLAAWVVAAKLYGLYDRDEERATHSTADEVVSVFHLITVGVWFFYATSWLVGLSHPNQRKLTTFWALAFLAVIGTRSVARALARRHPAFVQNTLIVGAGDVGVDEVDGRAEAVAEFGERVLQPPRHVAEAQPGHRGPDDPAQDGPPDAAERRDDEQ